MGSLSLSVVAKDGAIRYTTEGSEEVTLSWRGSYQPGDRLVVRCSEDPANLVMKLDVCLAESRVLLVGGRYEFPIPFGCLRKAYGKDSAFLGERHWGFVRLEDPREHGQWRNLALNSHDLGFPSNVTLYPHASTNVKCDNPQFFARNAIDGVFDAGSHGSWPHESWGINGTPDAWIKVDFGRAVVADELRVYLRADFPHDTWWKRALVELSDGSELHFPLKKTGRRQLLELGGRTIEWLRLSHLERAEADGFPGLSQIMVMGREA